MSPSQRIVADAAATWEVTDAIGRTLTMRRLGALDKLRLFKAAGETLSRNDPWLGMAMLASSVTAIDAVPVPVPVNEAQIEAIIQRLGDEGVAAIAAAIAAPPWEMETNPGNSAGTPI